MQKTKIEWCDITWNPVWGCHNECGFCYARKIAKRFGNKMAEREKRLRPEIGGLDVLKSKIRNFEPTWMEGNFQKAFPKKPCRIFVNSMSDVTFWKWAWLEAVLDKIRKHPQHTFIFLTKNPPVYQVVDFPDNCWLGVTITKNEDDLVESLLQSKREDNIVFISYEPILENCISKKIFETDWIIMGLETGRKNVFVPRLEVVALFTMGSAIYDTPVFMKDSMKKIWSGDLIQEFPGRL